MLFAREVNSRNVGNMLVISCDENMLKDCRQLKVPSMNLSELKDAVRHHHTDLALYFDSLVDRPEPSTKVIPHAAKKGDVTGGSSGYTRGTSIVAGSEARHTRGARQGAMLASKGALHEGSAAAAAQELYKELLSKQGEVVEVVVKHADLLQV